MSGQRQVANGIELDMVLDQAQANRLRGKVKDVELTRVRGGETVQEFAARSRPPTASRSGVRTTRPAASATSSTTAARRNPQLVKLEVLGHTGQGREIIAVKLTQGTGDIPDGTRPAVLYSSTSTRVNGSPPRSTGG